MEKEGFQMGPEESRNRLGRYLGEILVLSLHRYQSPRDLARVLLGAPSKLSVFSEQSKETIIL